MLDNPEVIKILIQLGGFGVFILYLVFKESKRDKKNEELIGRIYDKALYDNPRMDNSLVTIDKVLVDQLTKYENKNVKEHEELKKILTDHGSIFEQIKDELDDLYVVIRKGEDSATKTKHYCAVIKEKISENIEDLSDENLRIFIVEYSSAFTDWLMNSMDYLFAEGEKSSPEYVFEQFRAVIHSMKSKCSKTLKIDGCEDFFNSRMQEGEHLIIELRDIVNEKANDKKARFFNQSLLHLQKGMAKIILFWGSKTGKEIYVDAETKSKRDGLKMLRNLKTEAGK